jgi:four helix bundle protein
MGFIRFRGRMGFRKLEIIPSPLNLFTMLTRKTYSFEKFEVWQEARILVKNIYELTRTFPREERYGLTPQMRDAVISVSNNISEGTSRMTMKEQARFTEISFSSLIELLNELIASFDLRYIQESTLIEYRRDIDSIGYKLHQLRQSQMQIKKINSINPINRINPRPQAIISVLSIIPS